LEPKPTDSAAVLKKKAERKEAAQQLAVSWRSNFAEASRVARFHRKLQACVSFPPCRCALRHAL